MFSGSWCIVQCRGYSLPYTGLVHVPGSRVISCRGHRVHRGAGALQKVPQCPGHWVALGGSPGTRWRRRSASGCAWGCGLWAGGGPAQKVAVHLRCQEVGSSEPPPQGLWDAALCLAVFHLVERIDYLNG